MRNVLFGTAGIVLFVAVTASANIFWQPSTLRPAYAPADVTCYPIEFGYDLASVSPRPDVLATFVKRDYQKQATQICFLRVPSPSPEWIDIPKP